MSDNENILIQLYQDAVFKSVGRFAEVSFKNGKNGVGIFHGFHHIEKKLLFLNFCFNNSERLENRFSISLEDLQYFVVPEQKTQLEFKQNSNSGLDLTKTSSCNIPSRGKHFEINPGVAPKNKGIKNDTLSLIS